MVTSILDLFSCYSKLIYSSICIFSALIILVLLSFKLCNKKYFTKIISIKLNVGIFQFEGQIERNSCNIYIANRIYIELITRKAAIKFDREHDVIKEVYDSLYVLFKIIREEVKNLPAESIRKSHVKNGLIDLTIQILNKVLRPHLTKYQAKFRKWYEERLALDKGEVQQNKQTPQRIQKDYPDYEEMIKSIEDINLLLSSYSSELKKILES